MAQDRDELNKRRAAREARRKQREAQKKKLRMQLTFVAIALIACVAGIFLLTRSDAPETTETPTVPVTTVPETTAAPTEAASRFSQDNTVIHIRAAGDLNVTDKTVGAADTDLGYDYTRPFLDVAALLSDADLTIMNFEGNVCGEPYGSATRSAPKEMIEALANAGVDVLQMANSYSIYNGMIGLAQTLDNIRQMGIEPIGAYANAAEFRKAKGYTICEVQGVKVALVPFTKGMGSLGLPAGSEDCVNVLYVDYATTYRDVDEDKIKSILKSVASEEPDITIALLHWGSEYNDVISDTQKSILNLMKENGVDAIIGTHSHMVHEISYDASTGFLVAYSLGDFFGDGTRGGTNYSIILDLEITKDSETGETRITDYSYTPIYILSEGESADGYRRVVRIRETMAAFDVNYLDKVTKSAYNSMQTSLTRIADRTDPPEPTED